MNVYFLCKWSEIIQSCLTLYEPWTIVGPAPIGFSRQDTGLGCNFLTQESNLGLPCFRQTPYHLSHQGKALGISLQLAYNWWGVSLQLVRCSKMASSLSLCGFWVMVQKAALSQLSSLQSSQPAGRRKAGKGHELPSEDTSQSLAHYFQLYLISNSLVRPNCKGHWET